MNIIGRAERINLKQLGLSNLPAKIDTGAYSSSIDFSSAELVKEGAQEKLKVVLLRPGREGYTGQPILLDKFEMTEVKNSNGTEERFVIFADVEINGLIRTSRLTLAKRGHLRYPVLIGRKFLREAGMVVDVSQGQGLPDDEEERNL